MKGTWGFILLLVAVVIGGAVVWKKYEKKTVEAARTADFDRIQKEYLERVGWIRSNPEDRSYRDEVGTFFRWYFKEINEHHNRFGGNKNFDGYLEEIEKRSERLTDAQVAEKKKVYEYVKETFERLRAGNYSPIFTATSNGLRFDIVSADVKMVGGEPKIHMPLVLWGAQRELREDSARMKRMMTSATFAANWKLFDAKGKLYGEMNASGDPSNLVDWPDRFIQEFPAQVVLGQYEMDLLPAEVVKAEMEFIVTSRSPTGGEARGSFVWKLDVPAEWKLKQGETWKGATEDVRPPEEIEQKAQAQK
jgi:hypothetical protein